MVGQNIEGFFDLFEGFDIIKIYSRMPVLFDFVIYLLLFD